MNDESANHRQGLLDALRRFALASRSVPGVRPIALVGSIVTVKPDAKDIDVLVVVGTAGGGHISTTISARWC